MALFSQVQHKFNIILLLWCVLAWKNDKIAKKVKFLTFQAKITRIMVAPGSQHHKSSNFNEPSHRVSRPPAFLPPVTLQFQGNCKEPQCYGRVSIRRMPKPEMSPKVGQNVVSVARNIYPKFWPELISCWGYKNIYVRKKNRFRNAKLSKTVVLKGNERCQMGATMVPIWWV